MADLRRRGLTSGDLLVIGLALLAFGVAADVRDWPWPAATVALGLGAGWTWTGFVELLPGWRKSVRDWADAARSER